MKTKTFFFKKGFLAAAAALRYPYRMERTPLALLVLTLLAAPCAAQKPSPAVKVGALLEGAGLVPAEASVPAVKGRKAKKRSDDGEEEEQEAAHGVRIKLDKSVCDKELAIKIFVIKENDDGVAHLEASKSCREDGEWTAKADGVSCSIKMTGCGNAPLGAVEVNCGGDVERQGFTCAMTPAEPAAEPETDEDAKEGEAAKDSDRARPG
jgi:hypothetical protein